MSLCCPPGQTESSDATRSLAAPLNSGNDCAGSCTDTPLLTSVDVTATKNVAQACGAAALVPPSVVGVCSAPVVVGRDGASLLALSPPHLSRSTVLRI